MILSILVLLLSISGSFQPSPPEIHRGVPPFELWGLNGGSGCRIKFDQNWGVLGYETRNKLIRIDWFQLRSGSVFSQPMGYQNIALTYYPTAIVRSAANKICVAGKRENGFTVIQEFTLEPPTLRADAHGTEALDSKISGIAGIYDSADISRDMVVHMFRSMSSTPALFVQYWDSKDVYSVNLKTGVVTIQFRATQPSDAPLEERLSGSLSARFGGRDHPLMGYMYGFRFHSRTECGCLLLLDRNRDGILDSSLFLTDQDWAEMNLSDNSIYLDAGYLP